ncbi:MAG: cyclic nucleotide-binding domain-containing protein [Chloroflexi bacterium]|nr:cyclic nucleotide-binding domain-containing protein [Chloroflexota bacterium]
MDLNELRKSPLFQALSDEELKQLMDMAESVLLNSGDVLIRQGDPGDAAYIVTRGEFEVQKQSGQSMIKIDVRNPGDVLGEMALLARTPRTASVIARSEGEVLRISQEAFEKLLASNSSATMTILHSVMARLSQNEALLHQHEKMAALGTLSAGLAHELNNPAAAAQRSASELNKALMKWQSLTHQLELEAHKLNQTRELMEFMREVNERLVNPLNIDTLDKIDLTDELQSWLESKDIPSAWELAPAMIVYGWKSAELEKFQGTPLFNLSIQWLGIGCLTMQLLSEVQQTTERISQIVKAMKSYTYLDQAPLLEVDIHEGLENTLIIMQHKLKQGVTIRRDYAADLPHIEAYASELNQVWTNIIDNAIDAMNGAGEIILRTYTRDDKVVVEIIDCGSGVPEEIQPRIFEPFFTTKAPGHGTGLGLHISHDIIANRHHGQLLVESEPGATKFTAILPVRMKKT